VDIQPDGRTLLVVDSMSAGRKTTLKHGQNIVGFRIDQLNLNPGIYTVRCKLKNRRNSLIDRIDPAFLLEVTELPTAGHGANAEVRGPIVFTDTNQL
jgi:hypothetical protein